MKLPARFIPLSLSACAVGLLLLAVVGSPLFTQSPRSKTAGNAAMPLAAARDEVLSEAAEAAAPPPQKSEAAIERIIAPDIGLDAAVVVLGVVPSGEMETPARPDVVAWYNFSAKPGFGSNAVFAGHLDFFSTGPAVFWRLADLKQGSEIQIRLKDGTVYAYRVSETKTFRNDAAPVAEIVGPTRAEVITLITCAGSFNAADRSYDKRLVIRAVRQHSER